jgi:UPF0755 protein
MRRWLIAGFVFVGLGAALGYGLLVLYQAPGPLGRDEDVVVPRGGLDGVATVLAARGVVARPLVFRVFAELTAWQGKLRAAELSFPAGASVQRVLEVLRAGHPVQHLLTIPEGLTSAQVAGLLARADGLEGDVEVPPEGAVLPQTYAYVRGATRASVVARAETAMQQALHAAWAGRAAGLPLGSPRDVVVMASLVERETHLAAERPLVARVFFNRLARGMRLQSDPTVAYGESGGAGGAAAGLTHEALQRPTPYNTYVITGLPAGPICNPGIASIDAVVHPAESAALYFVADGTGGHVFSESLGEHEKNVKRYRALGR